MQIYKINIISPTPSHSPRVFLAFSCIKMHTHSHAPPTHNYKKNLAINREGTEKVPI